MNILKSILKVTKLNILSKDKDIKNDIADKQREDKQREHCNKHHKFSDNHQDDNWTY